MAKLLLDSRWTRRERIAYDAALRAGRFAECTAILQKHMTAEQKAKSEQDALEMMELFGVPRAPQERP